MISSVRAGHARPIGCPDRLQGQQHRRPRRRAGTPAPPAGPGAPGPVASAAGPGKPRTPGDARRSPPRPEPAPAADGPVRRPPRRLSSASSRPVGPARNSSASSALNTPTWTLGPRSAVDWRGLVISTRASPTGTNGRSTSGSSASSNTSRQQSPSASSQRRTVWPASAASRPEPPTDSPAASATAVRPASRFAGIAGIDPGHQPPASRQLRPRVGGRQLRTTRTQRSRQQLHTPADPVQLGQQVRPRLETRRRPRDITHHELVTRRLPRRQPPGSAAPGHRPQAD